MKLSTSIATFDALHRQIEKARKGTSLVKVERAGLLSLLLDHSALLAYAQKHGWRVEEKGTLSNP